MISKVDILKFVHHVVHRNAGRTDKRLVHPEREWIIGMLIAFCVGAAGAVYGSFFFVQQEEVVERNVSGDITAVRYRAGTVEEALGLYAARKEAFSALRGTYVPVVESLKVDVGEDIDEGTDTGSLRAE